jgi:methionyl aminopeptidase
MKMESKLIEKFKKACALTAEARRFAEGLIKEGAKVLDVANSVEAKIVQLGGKPAFPVNISINDIAAHYVPKANDDLVLKRGDLVKVDFGVHVDGCAGDIAFSVSVGKSDENESLIKAAKAALDAAIAAVKPDVEVCKIGAAIESVVKKAGFQPIRNLTGHGIKQFDLHTEPSIPNFDSSDKTKLEKDTIIAIEPFVTSGKGFVREVGSGEVYHILRFAPIRDGEILLYIQKEYNTLPFAKRWLVKKFGSARTANAIREALSRGILYEHKTLREVSGAKVAQAEHTILIADKIAVLTK